MSSLEFFDSADTVAQLRGKISELPSVRMLGRRRKLLTFLRGACIRVSLLTASLLSTFLVCEIIARAILPVGPVTNTPREVLAPGKIGYVPHSSWTVSEPEFTTDIAINSLGYRDVEIDLNKPTIVFLGDSQTFGTGVNQGERASDYVRSLLAAGHKDAEVPNILNVSMPGASTFDERRFLLDVIKKGVRVSHLVLLVSTNDHFANVEDEDDPIQRDLLEVKPSNYSPIKRLLKEYRYKSRLVQFTLQRLSQLSWFQSLYAEVKSDLGLGEFVALKNLYIDEREARSQVSATKRAVSALRAIAPVTIVIVPDRYRVDATLRASAIEELSTRLKPWQEIELDRESRLMREVATTLQVPFVDPTLQFQLSLEQSLLAYPLNGHLTKTGQELLGKIIATEAPVFAELLKKS